MCQLHTGQSAHHGELNESGNASTPCHLQRGACFLIVYFSLFPLELLWLLTSWYPLQTQPEQCQWQSLDNASRLIYMVK